MEVIYENLVAGYFKFIGPTVRCINPRLTEYKRNLQNKIKCCLHQPRLALCAAQLTLSTVHYCVLHLLLLGHPLVSAKLGLKLSVVGAYDPKESQLASHTEEVANYVGDRTDVSIIDR